MQNSQNTNDYRAAIEKRAYEIYLRRGATDGNDLDDWLIAEKEITSKMNREPFGVEIPRARASIATHIIENKH